MNVIYFDLNNFQKDYVDRSVCLGYFDAIHLGHKELIDQCVKTAKRLDLKASLISFDTNPKSFFSENEIKEINTLDERLEIFEHYGINEVILLHFDKEFANLSELEFIEKVLLKLNVKSITVGFDFSYGKNGSGNVNSLHNKLGQLVEVNVIESVNCDDYKISSTRVSKNLDIGNLKQVNRLLGYLYFVEGVVIKGSQIGRTIGFPTANIDYNRDLKIINNGVYIGFAEVRGKIYKAMCNIGFNPSINQQLQKRVEVNILDFSQDIYGEKLRFYFNELISVEKKYSSKDDLIEALSHFKLLASQQDDAKNFKIVKR